MRAFNTPCGYRTQQIMDAINTAECLCCGALFPVNELNEVGLCPACAEREEDESE